MAKPSASSYDQRRRLFTTSQTRSKKAMYSTGPFCMASDHRLILPSNRQMPHKAEQEHQRRAKLMPLPAAVKAGWIFHNGGAGRHRQGWLSSYENHRLARETGIILILFAAGSQIWGKIHRGGGIKKRRPPPAASPGRM